MRLRKPFAECDHQLFYATDKQDLITLSKVSSLWHRAATPWLYRNVAVSFRTTDAIWTARMLSNIMDGRNRMSRYRQYIQYLTIWMPTTKGDYFKRRMPRNLLAALPLFIATLINLKGFRYSTFRSNSLTELDQLFTDI